LLQEALKEILLHGSLEAFNPEFEAKAIQLFETVQVRHGLMVVGGTMSAKTTMIHSLADALTLINQHKAIEEAQSEQSSIIQEDNSPDMKDTEENGEE